MSIPRYMIQASQVSEIGIGYKLENFSSSEEMCNWAVEKSYEGIIVGRQMGKTYNFPSPTLKKLGFTYRGDILTPFVKMAHDKKLKVFVDIQKLSPGWMATRDDYTRDAKKIGHTIERDAIGAIVQEILNCGVDGIVEEGFNRVPGTLLTIARVCARNKAVYIHKNGGEICTFYDMRVPGSTNPRLLPVTVFDVFRELDEICCEDYDADRERWAALQLDTFTYGIAKGLGKKVSCKGVWLGGESGEPRFGEDSDILMQHLIFVRALQFKLDGITICLWANPPALTDISEHKALIKEYTSKQVKKPILDVVCHLKYKDFPIDVLLSSEAISSGALFAAYDLEVTDTVDPNADAYYILTRGYTTDADTLDLPYEIATLFDTDKPVFLQCIGYIPGDEHLTTNWTIVLKKVGLNTTTSYKPGVLPESGIYNGIEHKLCASYNNKPRNMGTIIPKSAIHGEIYSEARKNNIPFLIGENKKYLFTASCLHHENSFEISNLLNDTMQKPTDVSGVVGKRVTAFFTKSDTSIKINLPIKTSKIHVLKYKGEKGVKAQDENLIYAPPYSANLLKNDLLIIEALRR